jgi:hypothetical protein
MRYMIAAYESPEQFEARGDRGDGSARRGDYWDQWKAYGLALTQAGIVVEMNGIQPKSMARTIRSRSGVQEVEEGPYADTRDQLGGYFIVDVPDEASALHWAGRCSAALSGAVEVRPLLVKP